MECRTAGEEKNAATVDGKPEEDAPRQPGSIAQLAKTDGKDLLDLFMQTTQDREELLIAALELLDCWTSTTKSPSGSSMRRWHTRNSSTRFDAIRSRGWATVPRMDSGCILARPRSPSRGKWPAGSTGPWRERTRRVKTVFTVAAAHVQRWAAVVFGDEPSQLRGSQHRRRHSPRLRLPLGSKGSRPDGKLASDLPVRDRMERMRKAARRFFSVSATGPALRVCHIAYSLVFNVQSILLAQS
ncbi:hypothetical protein A4X13_0g8354 [Tilletia indica]|uniref:Uncharacterized protein n=1 Tax=Tilletia indica TaxID=43049 RepID=A0A8T8SF51_9BASI|nr:hypothetical protein A4X13_0g8354 [Tilletia indica]